MPLSHRFMVVTLALAVGACARDVRAANASSATTDDAARQATSAPAPAPAPASSAADTRTVVIPAGTRIGVRLNTGVSSNGSRVEEPVDATVIAPVRIHGTQVLPAGGHVKGQVVAAQRSGKVKGRARLALRFTTLTTSGESYPISAQVSRVAPATKKQDAEKIGIPAAGGAVVGAIVGGGKGAAIGAAAGGGAGTAVVLSTSGKEVSLPKGSVVALRLQKPVTVRLAAK